MAITEIEDVGNVTQINFLPLNYEHVYTPTKHRDRVNAGYDEKLYKLWEL